MELIPVSIFWSIAIWALFQRKQVLMYLFFASMPFGSFAAIPTELTAGLTLTPTPLVAILLIARELGSARGLRKAIDAALKPSGLLLLFLFWLVAGIVTIFMPRFFAGAIEIVPVRVSELATTAMLVPTIQNLSQYVYISISVLTVFAFASMLRSESMRRHALAAMCLGGALTVFTGLLDFLSQYLPIQPFLELFRTASYALLTDVEIQDVKRVVGLMPEASTFGTLSLSFLASIYFFRRAMPDGYLRNCVVPILLTLLLLFVWLSTSSAAYLGLCLFAAATAAEWCWRLIGAGHNPHLRRGISSEFWLAIVVIWVFLLIVISVPKVLTPVLEMFNAMVLQKTTTSSFEERSMWTQVSWNALLETYGLGVGMGSTRASNFAVALASNSGFAGALLYFTFVLQCLLLRRAPQSDLTGSTLLSAVRWSYLPSLLASLTVGTTPDFGVFNAFLYGFSVAIAKTRFQRTSMPSSFRTSSALHCQR
jgi:hypothetical protein